MLEYLDNEIDSDTCIILLHGFGANKEDLFSLQSLFSQSRVVSYQAPISLAPQGHFGGYAWFSLDFTPFGIQYDIDEAELALDMLYKEISIKRKEYSKLLICGFSQGCILTHGLLLRYPGLLDGAICLSGRYSEFVFEDADTKHLKDFPIFISHGHYDNVIPIDLGKKIISFYKASPAELTSKLYDMAHEISFECQKDVRSWYASHILI